MLCLSAASDSHPGPLHILYDPVQSSAKMIKLICFSPKSGLNAYVPACHGCACCASYAAGPTIDARSVPSCLSGRLGSTRATSATRRNNMSRAPTALAGAARQVHFVAAQSFARSGRPKMGLPALERGARGEFNAPSLGARRAVRPDQFKWAAAGDSSSLREPYRLRLL